MSSVIEYHPLYMRRLADVYLTKYGMLGFDAARKWFDTFLTTDLKKRIKPYIQTLAEERNLELT